MKDIVYHVSDNEDHSNSGVYRPREFRRRYPHVHKVFVERDMDYIQFDSGGGNVIVTEESADKFADGVIESS